MTIVGRHRGGTGRRRFREPHRRPLVLTLGAVLVYAALLVVAAGCVVWAVHVHAALSQPVHWGTYVETRCEPVRHGCDSYGTWTSADGRTTYRDVGFDGDREQAQPIRAGYRDFDADESGRPDFVSDVDSVDLGWLGPALGAVGALLGAVYLAGTWGDLVRLWRALPSRRRPRS